MNFRDVFVAIIPIIPYYFQIVKTKCDFPENYYEKKLKFCR